MKKMIKVYVFVTVLGVVFAYANCGFANPMKMDKNGYGMISRSEATGKMAQHFDRIDSNGDGQLEKDELMALRERMGGGRQINHRSDAVEKPPENFYGVDSDKKDQLDTNELFWGQQPTTPEEN